MRTTLLVADTAFVDPAVAAERGLLSVFPQRKGDGAYRATLDMLVRRSELQSAFYQRLLPKVVPVFAREMPAAGREAAQLVRPILVTLTSLCLDRAIRVLHRLRQDHGEVGVVSVTPPAEVKWLSEIADASNSSWRLNQDLIQRLAAALGVPRVEVFAAGSYPEYPTDHRQSNLLFVPQRGAFAQLAVTATNRLLNFAGRFSNPSARYQDVDFATDRYYLLKRGILGPFGIMRRNASLTLTSGTRDPEVRGRIVQSIGGTCAEAFSSLLAEAAPGTLAQDVVKLSTVFADLLVDRFPTSLLEGLSANLSTAAACLSPSTDAGVIGPNMIGTRGYILGTAARLAGMPVIGTQHGGYYGYIEDHSLVGELEYPFYDKLLTWGWTEIDHHFPQCETIPMPNPKLSERPLKASYSLRPKKAGDGTPDVLFLSNLFHRFPHISTCGQARVDFIDEITDSQEAMVTALSTAGVSIDHKPYNMRYVELYPEHFDRLRAAGGSGYRLLTSKQKGLDPHLIQGRRIVLWDQIGSGTLECLTSGVPTMIYWARVYSRETVIAKDLVLALERCGVVHRDPPTLAASVRKYLDDPRAWMTDPARRHAIDAFCRKFALTDPHWHKQWRQLGQLPAHKPASTADAYSVESR